MDYYWYFCPVVNAPNYYRLKTTVKCMVRCAYHHIKIFPPIVNSVNGPLLFFIPCCVYAMQPADEPSQATDSAKSAPQQCNSRQLGQPKARPAE